MRYPGYLNFSKEEIDFRAKKAYLSLKNCKICPWKCGVDRLRGEKGKCHLGEEPMISFFNPHFGEENVLVGSHGSGTIFFTSCNLFCVYCQNYEISQLRFGNEISYKGLAEVMLSIKDKGCHNLNLVTPTPQIPSILKALALARERNLDIPLVYNTNGYDSVETLSLLDGLVDIYMPDIKYFSKESAKKYSLASDYPEKCKEAVKEMHRQVGDLEINKEGVAKRGLLVRHLVLPNNVSNSKEVLRFIKEEISKDTLINIMDQYRPCYRASNYPELSRPLKKEEYNEVLKYAKELNLFNTDSMIH